MDAQTWNEAAYASQGFGAQRLYPNEELLRFMGRNFFGIPRVQRGAVKILEAGCGSGANLWMIAREGFDACGLDFSPSAIGHCQAMMEKWNTRATVRVGDMTAMPFPDATFDAVLDVFSAYSLTEAQFDAFLSESARVLKPGGRFFAYTPSKASDAFRDPGNVARIDASTWGGIRRESAPYCGSDHPFRFIAADEIGGAMAAHGFTTTHMERVSRTYRRGAEYFEFIVVEAIKSTPSR
jgi:SAM-dependent methyltransferase